MPHVIPETAEEAKSEIGIPDWIDPDIPLADPDLLDLRQGRERAGLGTRQADGNRQPWGHRGLGGGWTKALTPHEGIIDAAKKGSAT